MKNTRWLVRLALPLAVLAIGTPATYGSNQAADGADSRIAAIQERIDLSRTNIKQALRETGLSPEEMAEVFDLFEEFVRNVSQVDESEGALSDIDISNLVQGKLVPMMAGRGLAAQEAWLVENVSEWTQERIAIERLSGDSGSSASGRRSR